jgi:hypothetical protein
MSVPTYLEEFSPAFYLVVQFLPFGIIFDNNDFELPYGSKAFTDYNAKRLTNLDIIASGFGLPSNNNFNLQSLYQTGAPNAILILVERPLAPTLLDNVELEKLNNLNYQTITQQQFLYYRDNIINKMQFRYLAFQFTVAQLIDKVASVSDGRFKTLVQTFNNNNRVGINGTPSLSSNIQWPTFFINNSLIANNWSSYLYDATQVPSPPVRPANAGLTIAPVITLISRTPTEIIVEVAFGAGTYYQSQLRGFLVVQGQQDPIAGSIIQTSKVSQGIHRLTITGLDPATTYNYVANTQLINNGIAIRSSHHQKQCKRELERIPYSDRMNIASQTISCFSISAPTR